MRRMDIIVLEIVQARYLPQGVDSVLVSEWVQFRNEFLATFLIALTEL